jgi:hypothetical protein
VSLAAIAIGSVGVQVASANPLYQVNVTRVADNLYKEGSSGAYIETQACLEQAYNEQGALDYPNPPAQGTLYFNQSGRQCSVVRVLQDGASAPLTHDQQIEAVAQSMGWIRNAFADEATQANDARSFMQLQQNICNQQAAGFGGNFAAMPANLRNQCNAAFSVTL